MTSAAIHLVGVVVVFICGFVIGWISREIDG